MVSNEAYKPLWFFKKNKSINRWTFVRGKKPLTNEILPKSSLKYCCFESKTTGYDSNAHQKSIFHKSNRL